MSANKQQKDLIEQVEKLQRYCSQFCSRSLNIEQALGVTGSNLLNSVFEKTTPMITKTNKFLLELFNVPVGTSESDLTVQNDNIAQWKLKSVEEKNGEQIANIEVTTKTSIPSDALDGEIVVSVTNHEVQGTDLYIKELEGATVMNANPNQQLKPFHVSVYEDKGDQNALDFYCQAECEDSADEQALAAYPNGEVRHTSEISPEEYPGK